MAYKAFDLTGKVSLVTGGNSGIGLGMAEALAQAGAGVCIWGTNEEKNAAALKHLSQFEFGEATFLHAFDDVRRDDEFVGPPLRPRLHVIIVSTMCGRP